MSKLYFRYGTMGSSKTANALMTKFNYEEKGYNVLLIKPSIDNRDGKTIIKSRIGLESEAIVINPQENLMYDITVKYGYHIGKYRNTLENPIDCIIVDEAQFLSKENIEDLKQIADTYETPVFCYGLRTDFQSNLFEGSKRLFEISDSISEIKSICHCGNKAIINAKYNDNQIIYDGEQIDIGGNDKYIGLCYRCWVEGKLNRHINKINVDTI